MRDILINGQVNYLNIFKSISIAIAYFTFGVIVFYISYLGAKKRGTLINMGNKFMNEIIKKIKKLEVSAKGN